MTKLQFLCVNHRRWISDNPEVANRTWLQAYSRGVELLDEYRYPQAVRHAGAAFETADIMLTQGEKPTDIDIQRFSDSGLLLIQLLHLLDEEKLSMSVMASAIGRLERMPLSQVARIAAMADYNRIREISAPLPRSRVVAKAHASSKRAKSPELVH